jgi:hypothetical protein
MRPRKFIHLLLPLSSLACLAVGFTMVQQWLFLPTLLIVLLLWLLPLKWPSRWLPLVALALTLSLSAAGSLLGASSVVMLLAATLALATWDLALLELSLAGLAPTPNFSRLTHSHYVSLAGALALGLLAALAGRMLRLQLPFGILLLLALLVLLAIDRLWRALGG